MFTAIVYAPFLLGEFVENGQYLRQLEMVGGQLRERAYAHRDTHVRIVDAGCNVGLFPLFAQGYVGPVHVLGFDPLLCNVEAAHANWEALPHTAYGVCLGARTELQVPLHLMSSTGCTLNQPEVDEWVLETGKDTPETALVDVQPLDAFDTGRVDLIKLDVEGSEEAVLEGAAAILERDRPFVICSYEHPSNDPDRICALLPGYHVDDDTDNRLLTFTPDA